MLTGPQVRLVLAMTAAAALVQTLGASFNYILDDMLRALGSSASQSDISRQMPTVGALLVTFVAGTVGQRLGSRRVILTCCGLYALGTALVMWLSDWVDAGSFERLQEMLAKGEAAQAEVDALLADPRLTGGLIVRFGLAACLSVPFWHAPPLVYWQGQGVGQSLFSSTLALWRCRGAFVVYALAWAGVVLAFGAVAALLFSLLGARQLAGMAAMPAALIFSTVFYVSLLFTYEGCFSDSAAAPAAG